MKRFFELLSDLSYIAIMVVGIFVAVWLASILV